MASITKWRLENVTSLPGPYAKQSHGNEPGSSVVSSTTPARYPGKRSAFFHVGPTSFGDDNRMELHECLDGENHPDLAEEGTTNYYAFSVWFPTSYPDVDGHQIFMQGKNRASNVTSSSGVSGISPQLEIMMSGPAGSSNGAGVGGVIIGIGGGNVGTGGGGQVRQPKAVMVPRPVPRSTWLDFIVRETWHPSNGACEVWYRRADLVGGDFRRVYSVFGVPTTFVDLGRTGYQRNPGVGVRYGMYRASRHAENITKTLDLHFTGHDRAGTYTEGLSRFSATATAPAPEPEPTPEPSLTFTAGGLGQTAVSTYRAVNERTYASRRTYTGTVALAAKALEFAISPNAEAADSQPVAAGVYADNGLSVSRPGVLLARAVASVSIAPGDAVRVVRFDLPTPYPRIEPGARIWYAIAGLAPAGTASVGANAAANGLFSILGDLPATWPGAESIESLVLAGQVLTEQITAAPEATESPAALIGSESLSVVLSVVGGELIPAERVAIRFVERLVRVPELWEMSADGTTFRREVKRSTTTPGSYEPIA